MGDITFSHNSDEWETPADIIADLVASEGIAVDTACNSKNMKLPVGLCIDQGVDGLVFPWHQIPVLKDGGAAFCNPPHSKIVKWIEKCIGESRRGVKVVMLIPASTGTKHWHHLILPFAVEIKEVEGRICFKGRIKSPGQPKDLPKDEIKYKIGTAPATFDSAIVTFDISRPRVNGGPLRTEYVQPKDRKKGE